MNDTNPIEENPTNEPLNHNSDKASVSPKTVAYLHAMADKAEQLYDIANMYKEKHANAKTNFAKELYAKKLKKATAKLDNIVKLFAAISQDNKGE